MTDEQPEADADGELVPSGYRKARREEAITAGLTEAEADLFADGDVPLATLRHCVARGATPEQMARVVI